MSKAEVAAPPVERRCRFCARVYPAAEMVRRTDGYGKKRRMYPCCLNCAVDRPDIINGLLVLKRVPCGGWQP